MNSNDILISSAQDTQVRLSVLREVLRARETGVADSDGTLLSDCDKVYKWVVGGDPQ